MRRNKSWIKPDFGDDDDGFSCYDKREAESFNRPAPKQRRLGHSSVCNDFRSWSAKHCPLQVSSLAVHPKKTADLRTWLSNFDTFSNGKVGKISPILLLKGPSGSGKTTAVKVLAHELNFQVQEWQGYQEVAQYHSDILKDDEQAFFRANDVVPFTSQVKAFESFIIRANKYNVINEMGSSANKLVLLDVIPSFAFRHPADFHRILKAYKSKSAKYPLIIVLSENEFKEESRQLFPDHLINSLDIHVMNFNPISSTNMNKALKAIAQAEASSNSKKYSVPSKEVFSVITESNNGDLRAAINALQFACLRGYSNMSSFSGSSSTAKSSSKRSKAGNAVQTSNNVLKKADRAKIGGNDPSLDLFHAIGKVLYCKREEKAESFPLKNPLLKRNVLLRNPEEILHLAPMNEENFTCFLHQSHTGFFNKIEDLSNAAEYLSISDMFFNQWQNSTKMSSLAEYGGIVAVRGLLFTNTSEAKQKGLRTFQKPEWYKTSRLVRQRSEALIEGFRIHSLPTSELCTTLAPFVNKFFSNLAPSKVKFSPNDEFQFKAPMPKLEIQSIPNTARTEDDPEEDFFIEESE